MLNFIIVCRLVYFTVRSRSNECLCFRFGIQCCPKMSERKIKRILSGVTLVGILWITIHSLWGTTITMTISPPYTINSPNYTYVYPLEELTVDDYSRLIDITNFKFSLLSDICRNSTRLTLLILIHSSTENFDKRQLIRKTWGHPRKDVRIGFMIGTVSNKTLGNKLIRENKINRDLIQGSFVDAYRNMTYKHAMVLKYASYHCPQAKYILKADDDIFVNIEALLVLLNEYFESVSNLLLCKVIRHAKVFRSFRSKWRVSFLEYPARTYPTYCLGFAVLYSPDVLFELYKNVQKLSYFWIDDVHITGTTVVGTNITHTDVSRWVRKLSELNESNVHKVLYGDPSMEREEVLKMWNYTQHAKYSSKYALNWFR